MKSLLELPTKKFNPSRLKDLRTMKRMSHRQMGELIGCSRVSVINWETGKCLPGVDVIDVVCQAFNIDQSYFWS